MFDIVHDTSHGKVSERNWNNKRIVGIFSMHQLTKALFTKTRFHFSKTTNVIRNSLKAFLHRDFEGQNSSRCTKHFSRYCFRSKFVSEGRREKGTDLFVAKRCAHKSCIGTLDSTADTVAVTVAPSFKSCNGRALDRVTKQKHRPNRQEMSQKCPKIVFAAPPDNFWTFFRHFFDILSTFQFSLLSNDLLAIIQEPPSRASNLIFNAGSLFSLKPREVISSCHLKQVRHSPVSFTQKS